MFYRKTDPESTIDDSVDEYGDSFARDISVEELKEVRHCILTGIGSC